MNDAIKRQLKKPGKQMVEQQSRDLHARRAEANPAPIGSDEWASNDKSQVVRERELRKSPTDRITASDAPRDFVFRDSTPVR